MENLVQIILDAEGTPVYLPPVKGKRRTSSYRTGERL